MKQKNFFLQLSAIVFGIIIVFYLAFYKATPVKIISAKSTQLFDNNIPLAGYAWSSNIGWIKFFGDNYGVKINLLTGTLSGYVWSSNIGWINFAPDVSAAPEAPKQIATVDFKSGNVTGWARAVAPINNTNAGGWDGWIKMSGRTTNNNSYGVIYTFLAGDFSGYAWGGDVVGWINFGNTLSNNYGAVMGPISYLCQRFGNPTISWSPFTILIGQPITFKYTIDPNPQLSISLVAWDFGSAASPLTSALSSPTITFTKGSNLRTVVFEAIYNKRNICTITKTLAIGGKIEF